LQSVKEDEMSEIAEYVYYPNLITQMSFPDDKRGKGKQEKRKKGKTNLQNQPKQKHPQPQTPQTTTPILPRFPNNSTILSTSLLQRNIPRVFSYEISMVSAADDREAGMHPRRRTSGKGSKLTIEKRERKIGVGLR